MYADALETPGQVKKGTCLAAPEARPRVCPSCNLTFFQNYPHSWLSSFCLFMALSLSVYP